MVQEKIRVGSGAGATSRRWWPMVPEATGQDKGKEEGRKCSNWNEEKEMRGPPQRPVLRPNATGGRARHHPN